MTVLRTRSFVTAGTTIALAAAGVIAPALSASAAVGVGLNADTKNPVAGQSFKVDLSGLTTGTNYRVALAAQGVTDTTNVAESNSCTTDAAAAAATLTCTLTETTKGSYTLNVVSGNTVVASQQITVADNVGTVAAPKFTDRAGSTTDIVTVYKNTNIESWTIADASATPTTVKTADFGTFSYKDVTVTPKSGSASTDVTVTAKAASGFLFADGTETMTWTYRMTAADPVPSPVSVSGPTPSDAVGTDMDTLTFTKTPGVTWTLNGVAVDFGDGTTVKVPVTGTRDDKGMLTAKVVATAAEGYTFGDGTTTKAFSYEFTNVAAEPSIVRVAGDDRAATAVEIAKKYYPGQRDVVYVANGLKFPDALASGPAAARSGAPLLLSQQTWIGDSVLAEIKRMAPKEIRLVGGSDVVSDGVAAQLGKIATVRRVAGDNRYSTAVQVSQRWTEGAKTVYIANGLNFPDALSGGSGAAAEDAPMLLTNGTTLSDETIVELRRLKPTKIVLVGGDKVVSASVAKQAGDAVSGVNVVRAGGKDRYETSALIIENVTGKKDKDGNLPSTAFVATGLNFPDALAGIPAAYSAQAPLALTMQNCVPASVKSVLDPMPLKSTVRLGSSNVVGDFSIRTGVCG